MARLIDADALKAKANADPDSGEGFVWVQDIDEAHTVDAVPVVHGRWVDNGIPESMLSGCSVCGFSCGAYSFNYCPNCGATMDLEEEE